MILQIRNHNLDLNRRCHIMGILNVTPDSFSDGGKFFSEPDFIRHINDMVSAGADIIDVGGESSRPFSQPVTLDEELRRVIPAIRAIRREHDIPVSIDTTKAEIARQALEAGADIINDISALRFDPEMVSVVKTYKAPLIIMHMQGTPGDMQLSPIYSDVVAETIAFFSERISWLKDQGVSTDSLILDPGIGFGKTPAHNLTILKNIDKYSALGCPILVGHSRKSFLAGVLGSDKADRENATAAISAILALRHTAIIRVHDIAKNRQAIEVAQAIMAA